ncbi:hypothetical protein POVCU2_0075270 [Plasmodium ovale curtisi]|uniref:Uncharacterized protein n=1 Tax=Plasmodium ovale curtisi TaxID=864141 RepID=A0A1A8WL94_PLAOA|nr:hypothetical protein POVCU2_0075270 [Plasmodium ovale curtisi]
MREEGGGKQTGPRLLLYHDIMSFFSEQREQRVLSSTFVEVCMCRSISCTFWKSIRKKEQLENRAHVLLHLATSVTTSAKRQIGSERKERVDIYTNTYMCRPRVSSLTVENSFTLLLVAFPKGEYNVAYL